MEPGTDTTDELLAALLRAWLVAVVASLAIASILLLARAPSTGPASPSLGETWADLSEAGAL